MGQNRLAIAGVALVLIGGLAAWQLTARHSEENVSSGAGIRLPKVDRAKIDSLEVSIPGKPTVLLTKQGDVWKMTQPMLSAVETSAVEAALSKLAELEVAGVAATRKENHERLEVGPTAGIRVVAKQGAKALCDLVIGKYVGGNTMVREHSADKVATVRGSIRYAFAKDVKEWRDHTIASFDIASAKSVSFVSPKGSFTFLHNGETWAQGPGETALPELDGGKVQSLVSALSGLRTTDFAAAEVTVEQAGLAPNARATVTITLGGDAGAQQVLVRFGNADDEVTYVMAEGNPVIFKLSNLQADRFMPDAAAFKPSPPPPPDPNQPQIDGLPPGMKLPPNVLEQIMQQQKIGQ